MQCKLQIPERNEQGYRIPGREPSTATRYIRQRETKVS